jgi:hypothetical protein
MEAPRSLWDRPWFKKKKRHALGEVVKSQCLTVKKTVVSDTKVLISAGGCQQTSHMPSPDNRDANLCGGFNQSP